MVFLPQKRVLGVPAYGVAEVNLQNHQKRVLLLKSFPEKNTNTEIWPVSKTMSASIFFIIIYLTRKIQSTGGTFPCNYDF